MLSSSKLGFALSPRIRGHEHGSLADSGLYPETSELFEHSMVRPQQSIADTPINSSSLLSYLNQAESMTLECTSTACCLANVRHLLNNLRSGNPLNIAHCSRYNPDLSN
ncbi:hypothetical protein Fot_34284 [Forsythia ovata]|uniref:Uncharacterized protein n=1 Tax=Forsythia ovata TaxID=205694 RepID=A0ABD1SI77_9LAMI